jgi:hypothetical protein
MKRKEGTILDAEVEASRMLCIGRKIRLPRTYGTSGKYVF